MLMSNQQPLQCQIFKHQQYHILIAELCHPVKSFSERFIYVKHVKSILVKMKFHVWQSAIKWL